MTPVIVSKDIGTCCQGDISPNKAISPPKPKTTPTIMNICICLTPCFLMEKFHKIDPN